MAHVLCVGTATLDIVNRVPDYPAEDTEVRALSQSQRMGGNAANTAIVLARLGVQTSWAGTLAEQADVVEHTFAHYGVDAGLATRVAGGTMPTSYIVLSEATGSRSIIHYRDLREYGALDFGKLDLSDFDLRKGVL